jgi:enamine deaminase RidA (YjgF/YER057c/UK114 family)
MTSKQYLNPDTMAQPSGFTNVVKVGNTVYIAGQVSRDTSGNFVGVGDAEAQVRQVWKSLEAAVKAAGGDGLGNLVKTTTYITSIEYSAAVRKVRDELFQSVNPPTSTLLVISELASPEYLVEIEAIASV